MFTIGRVTAIAALVVTAQQVSAQSCYYPNGDIAPPSEKPCSTQEGSACCPDNWLCLDNGLCQYPPENLFERHSCTDKNWQAPGCPSNLCSYGGQASGGESITQCLNHNDNWCCNADAQQVDCCRELPVARPFFALDNGRPYARIGVDQASYAPNLSSITGIAISTGTGEASTISQTTLSGPFSTTSRSASEPSKTTTATTMVKSVSSSMYPGSANQVTIDVAPLMTSSPETTSGVHENASPDSSSRSRRIGLIIGYFISIPLGLALVGILVRIVHKRRKSKTHPYIRAVESKDRRIATIKAKRRGENCLSVQVAELDGRPSRFDPNITTVMGFIELEAGTHFQSGRPTSYRSNIEGIGGSTGTERPLLGSATPRTPRTPRHPPAAYKYYSPDTVETDGTSLIGSIDQNPRGHNNVLAGRSRA